MKEWMQRTELLLGSDRIERLRNARVLVVGLGGVGAYAAEAIRKPRSWPDGCWTSTRDCD